MPTNKLRKLLFSRKLNIKSPIKLISNKKPNHPSLNFKNTVVIQSMNHKHLGMILDTKLDFQEHFKGKLSKIRQLIGILSYTKY